MKPRLPPGHTAENAPGGETGLRGGLGPPSGPNLAKRRRAYSDTDFLQRPESRGIQIQRELLTAELALRESGVLATVVVFGGARVREPFEVQRTLDQAHHDNDAAAIEAANRRLHLSTYYDQALRFAGIVSRYSSAQSDLSRKLYICTGGGPGIMEAANRGAFEVKAPSIGLNIELPEEQQVNPYVSPQLCFHFDYFAARKLHFVARAKAFVAFPGGFGTLDEVFEVLTLTQCNKLARVPLVLYGRNFWKHLINFEMLVNFDVVPPADVELIQFADSPEERGPTSWSSMDLKMPPRARLSWVEPAHTAKLEGA